MPGPSRCTAVTSSAAKRAGFVLPVVLIVLALLTVMSMAMSQMARDRVAEIQMRKELWEREKAARAASEAIIYALLTGSYGIRSCRSGDVELNIDGRPSEIMNAPVVVQDGAGLFSLAFYNEAKFRLLIEKLVDANTARKISAELGDWIDEDSRARFRGLESAGYRARGLPQRPRNAPVRSVEELLQLPSMTADIFYGAEGKPGIRELVLAGGSDHFNMGTAPEWVLGPMLGTRGAHESALLSAKLRENWQAMLEMVSPVDWVFNQASPLAPGARYVVKFPAGEDAPIRLHVYLDPFAEDIPYKLIDWRVPDYGSG